MTPVLFTQIRALVVGTVDGDAQLDVADAQLVVVLERRPGAAPPVHHAVTRRIGDVEDHRIPTPPHERMLRGDALPSREDEVAVG